MADETSTWDRSRALVGAVGAPLVALAIGLGGTGDQAVLGALCAATAILWITEALPTAVTSLLAVSCAVIFGLATPKEAFAAFGNPILFLFLGSFLVAEAMNLHGLGARLARFFTARAKGPLGVIVATSSAAFVLSMWTSNAAATAVVLPIALAAARTLDKRTGAALVLAVAWGASMGGLATPVGTPPNLIGVRALTDNGAPVGFFGWMELGLPLGIAMQLAMWLVVAVVFRVRPSSTPVDGARERAPSSVDAPPADAASPSPAVGRAWTRGEIGACVAFVGAVVLWMAPGVLESLGSTWAKPLHAHVPEEIVALLAAALLFCWPADGTRSDGSKRTRALEWRDAQNIDWGTLLLFGGGVLLGDLANKKGLAQSFGSALVDVSGAHSQLGVVALVTATSLVLSELASNTASATLMVPVAIGLASSTHTPVLPAVLAAAIGSSFGFMMPISTAPNAMAYATGKVTIREMLLAGVLFDAVGFVVVVAGVELLAPLISGR